MILNGRFLSRQLSGVDRVALELSKKIASLQAGDIRLEIAIPRNAPPDGDVLSTLGLSAGVPVHRGRLSGYLWEQVELPLLRPNLILLSLANIGPVFRHNQAVMIHDAQVFEYPESYARAFRIAYRMLLPSLARRAKYLLTVSQYSADALANFGLDRTQRAKVIHNGVDHFQEIRADKGILTRYGLRHGNFFLSVGSNAAHKNMNFLDKIFSNPIMDESLPLVVVGGVNDRVFESKSISRVRNIQLVGRVSDNELKALFENARAFLFPSLTEGFGLPPLEAMSCGCPVIASTGGAIPEICDDAAILCDPTDSDAWLSAIIRVQKDDKIAGALSVKGKRRSQMFSWERAAREVLTIL